MLPPDDSTNTWRLPVLPSGGPEAAREVAATCDRLAALLRSTAVTLGGVRQLCATNTGRSGEAIGHTLGELQREHDDGAHNFGESARTMRKLADELAASHRRHHFSLGRLVTLGATVVVGAAAVYVTVGVAGPAVAAAVGAEVAVVEEAAAAATAASESAAAECSLLARAFTAIRGLCSISRTQVAYAEVWMTAQSVRSQVMDDRLWPKTSPGALALDVAGIAVGAGAGKFANLALAGRAGTAMTAVGTTAASAAGGAVPQTAYDWERTGSFPARSFAWNAAKGATSSVISGSGKKLIKNVDKWKAKHRPRPQPGKHRR
jgi:hypothetical protein